MSQVGGRREGSLPDNSLTGGGDGNVRDHPPRSTLDHSCKLDYSFLRVGSGPVCGFGVEVDILRR